MALGCISTLVQHRASMACPKRRACRAMPAQSSGVPAGKLLVTAGTDGAFVALRQSVETVIGLSDDDLIKNLRTVLVEGRMTPNVRNAQLSYAGDLIAP